MSFEQRGLFDWLLCIAWGQGQDEPSLPADDEELRELAQCARAIWKRSSGVVLACFTARDGRLYNDKLTRVWEVQRARNALLSDRGRAGAQARWKESPSNAQGMLKQCDGNGNKTQSKRKAVPSPGRTPAPTSLAALVPSARDAIVRKAGES